MVSDERPGTQNDPYWYDFLTKGDATERRLRRIFRHIPYGPRCKLCAAPFKGPGAPIMRVLGSRPSDKNPNVCTRCFTYLADHHGGAEIEASMMFADIRGSTSLAERMSTAEFHAILDRFYVAATKAVFDNDGSLDKFVGDEVVAMFFPLMSGPDHAAMAIRAAEALLRATGHADPAGPWVPVGAGVHTGPAWVGAIGDEAHTELTAVGDTVNTTARLAAEASAGEAIVSVAAARAAGLDPSLERRSLELKGKEAPTEVVSLRVAATTVAKRSQT